MNPRTRSKDIARFIDYAVGFTSDVCLYWPFGKNSAGYGHFTIAKKWTLAHRVVCERVYGPAPIDAGEAAHHCGKGHLGCVNPKHLAWKSRKANCRDMVVHGTSCRGQKQHMAKLTPDAVRFIRQNRSASPKRLAGQFGVTPGAIYAVLRGKTWAWVSDEVANAA